MPSGGASSTCITQPAPVGKYNHITWRSTVTAREVLAMGRQALALCATSDNEAHCRYSAGEGF